MKTYQDFLHEAAQQDASVKKISEMTETFVEKIGKIAKEKGYTVGFGAAGGRFRTSIKSDEKNMEYGGIYAKGRNAIYMIEYFSKPDGKFATTNALSLDKSVKDKVKHTPNGTGISIDPSAIPEYADFLKKVEKEFLKHA